MIKYLKNVENLDKNGIHFGDIMDKIFKQIDKNFWNIFDTMKIWNYDKTCNIIVYDQLVL